MGRVTNLHFLPRRWRPPAKSSFCSSKNSGYEISQGFHIHQFLSPLLLLFDVRIHCVEDSCTNFTFACSLWYGLPEFTVAPRSTPVHESTEPTTRLADTVRPPEGIAVEQGTTLCYSFRVYRKAEIQGKRVETSAKISDKRRIAHTEIRR